MRAEIMPEPKTYCDPAEESALIRRAIAGDRTALSSLLRTHESQIWAVCRRMMAGCAEDAPDVAQDAMVRIVRELHRFDPDGSARFATWVVTLATRICLDALRRSRLRQASPLRLRAPTEPLEPETVSYARQVEACVARLPPEQRAVIVLRAYHDLDLDEIADALGVARGTVKSRLFRARAALRGLLED